MTLILRPAAALLLALALLAPGLSVARAQAGAASTPDAAPAAAASSAASAASAASSEDLRAAVDALAVGKYRDRVAAIGALAALGDARAARALRALLDGDLYVTKDGAAVIGRRDGREMRLSDALTGAEIGVVPRREAKKIRVNNAVRRAIRPALGALQLAAETPAARTRAARALMAAAVPEMLPALDAAIAREQDPTTLAALEAARAAAILADPDADSAQLEAAIERIAARGNRDAIGLLASARGHFDAERQAVIDAGIAEIERSLIAWEIGQNVWYGLSLGSVLLLAAIGLAITFGVMGVINMAHGEMVMIGAYAAWGTQQAFQAFAPGWLDASLAVALPAAFLCAGAVGVALERLVIRHLYGRPLETLLATWGVSLILQQAVRSLFGPTNREVTAPSWMTGAFEIGQLSITWNRLWIVMFALAVLFGLMIALKRSRFGLFVRAVTQNRPMADCMGVRTGRVDALTFGLGCGVAGLAGVALSQIDNVSPNLGQAYIVDSFMVVVFGGVGNLWGSLVGAMSLGVANKMLEPYAGAVLGKIVILVLIIAFIQKRPRGLFALRGRAVEA